MDFAAWIQTQPYGTLKRIEREHRVGYMTLHRLKKGERLDSYELASRVSRATDGAVSIDELCAPRSDSANPESQAGA